MNTIVNFRTKQILKDEAQATARELGVSLGTVMNAYLEEFVREKKLLLTKHPTPTKAALKEVQTLSVDAKNGTNMSPGFTNADDAITWLGIAE